MNCPFCGAFEQSCGTTRHIRIGENGSETELTTNSDRTTKCFETELEIKNKKIAELEQENTSLKEFKSKVQDAIKVAYPWIFGDCGVK